MGYEPFLGGRDDYAPIIITQIRWRLVNILSMFVGSSGTGQQNSRGAAAESSSCLRMEERKNSSLIGKATMAQNHYETKTKRRQKNKKRKDPSAATMAKLRQLEAAEKARQGK
jgi:hypothetical protein